MGNVSSVRESGGEGEGSNSGEHEGGGSQDSMGQSPPQSPRGPAQSPMLFTPQMPVAPLQRFDDEFFLNYVSRHNSIEYEDMFSGQCIPTMITWSHGGEEVAVLGSWDNWKTKQPLQRSGKDFNIMKALPSGVYQYRFIVDGESSGETPTGPFLGPPGLPLPEGTMPTSSAALRDFVPDDIENVAGFEPPQSPESSYNNWPLGLEDFSKEPPMAPPQLNVTLLNTPSPVENSSSLSRPQHAVLNHLYIQKSKNAQPMVALGVTHRFLSKFVTVVLYKSFQR